MACLYTIIFFEGGSLFTHTVKVRPQQGLTNCVTLIVYENELAF